MKPQIKPALISKVHIALVTEYVSLLNTIPETSWARAEVENWLIAAIETIKVREQYY